MLKTFVFFGYVCFFNHSEFDTCFNIFERPMINYPSAKICKLAADTKAINVRKELTEKGLTISEGSLWCFETTKTN